MRLNSSYAITTLLFLSFLLGACTSTSTSTAVNVRDIDSVESQTPNSPLPVKSQAKSSPVYQERAPQALPIVERLLSRANTALAAKQSEQAITLAEKGLRIERKEPRFYWVLASAYAQLSKQKQSQDFARQGLRYATKNSPIARQLKSYLP